jgi:transposase-like protein
MALAELLQKSGDGDFLRTAAGAVLQILMEADVEGLIGAGRHERTGDRLNYRNGYRERSLDTRLGSLSLRIPKLRQGSYFPPFLEPRKTAEKALVMVIQEAWIGGVSTRPADELVQAMGLSGISKSQVSNLCKDIDERVNAFLDRPIEGEWPYLWLDATLPEGARRRPYHLGCRNNRRCREHRRPARDRRSRHRALGSRAVLVGLHQGPGQAWVARRQAGDLRCP